MIVPLVDQLPPRGVPASASVSGDPELISIRFSFPSAKNPRYCESGDQKGKLGFSVLRKTWATCESSGRSQIAATPSFARATTAIVLPSGDMTAVAASKTNDVPSGASISLYFNGETGQPRRIVHAPTTTPITSESAAANTISGKTPERRMRAAGRS